MKRIAIVAVLIAGCAGQHAVTLLPRGTAPQGTGTLSRMDNKLTVELDGRKYRGPMVVQTSHSSLGLFGPARTTVANQATALLIGESGGQIRCEFGFDAMWTSATGVCVDWQNRTYDMLVK